MFCCGKGAVKKAEARADWDALDKLQEERDKGKKMLEEEPFLSKQPPPTNDLPSSSAEPNGIPVDNPPRQKTPEDVELILNDGKIGVGYSPSTDEESAIESADSTSVPSSKGGKRRKDKQDSKASSSNSRNPGALAQVAACCSFLLPCASLGKARAVSTVTKNRVSTSSSQDEEKSPKSKKKSKKEKKKSPNKSVEHSSDTSATIYSMDLLQGFWMDAKGDQHDIDAFSQTIDSYIGKGLKFTFQDNTITVHWKGQQRVGRLAKDTIHWDNGDLWTKIDPLEPGSGWA